MNDINYITIIIIYCFQNIIYKITNNYVTRSHVHAHVPAAPPDVSKL